MLRLPYRLLLPVGLLALGDLAGCSSDSSSPSEYISFKYSITPPGFMTNAPIVLPSAPAPSASGMTCFKQQQKLIAYGRLGAASVQISLTGADATRAYQKALQASSQTLNVAEMVLDIPLSTDEMGNYINPVSYRTSTPGNMLTCYLNMGGPDLFASFDADFTCDSLSTDSGRQLHITEGKVHILPCPVTQ